MTNPRYAVIYGNEPQWNDARNATKWFSCSMTASDFAQKCKQNKCNVWLLTREKIA
jgi:hypothetical protein